MGIDVWVWVGGWGVNFSTRHIVQQYLHPVSENIFRYHKKREPAEGE